MNMQTFTLSQQEIQAVKELSPLRFVEKETIRLVLGNSHKDTMRFLGFNLPSEKNYVIQSEISMLIQRGEVRQHILVALMLESIDKLDQFSSLFEQTTNFAPVQLYNNQGTMAAHIPDLNTDGWMFVQNYFNAFMAAESVFPNIDDYASLPNMHSAHVSPQQFVSPQPMFGQAMGFQNNVTIEQFMARYTALNAAYGLQIVGVIGSTFGQGGIKMEVAAERLESSWFHDFFYSTIEKVWIEEDMVHATIVFPVGIYLNTQAIQNELKRQSVREKAKEMTATILSGGELEAEDVKWIYEATSINLESMTKEQRGHALFKICTEF